VKPPPRPRGRPPLDRTDPSVNMHVRVTTRAFDALYAHAKRERLTFADYVRQRLREPERGEPCTNRGRPSAKRS
jgi:hypothetical protein